MAIIYLLSSLPADSIPRIGLPHLDKAVHCAEYAVLGLLVVRSLRDTFPHTKLMKLAVLSVIITTLYAVSDEAHQRFVPGRDPDGGDLAADVMGAVCGALLAARNAKRERCQP